MGRRAAEPVSEVTLLLSVKDFCHILLFIFVVIYRGRKKRRCRADCVYGGADKKITKRNVERKDKYGD